MSEVFDGAKDRNPDRVATYGELPDRGGLLFSEELNLVFDFMLDPRYFGVKSDNATNDTAAWGSVITYLEALPKSERPLVLMPRGKSVINDRLIFPSQSSIMGHGVGSSQFKCFGPDSGVAFVNYNPDGAWSSGLELGVTASDFSVAGNGQQTGGLCHFGLAGRHSVNRIEVSGSGANGVEIYGSQDSSFDNIVARDNAGHGAALDFGAANNKIELTFCASNDASQLYFGDGLTSHTSTFGSFGPSRNDVSLQADFIPEGSHGVFARSGRNNVVTSGRCNRYLVTTRGALIKVEAPTVTGMSHVEGMSIERMTLRAQVGTDADNTFILDSTSTHPVTFKDCKVETLNSFPLIESLADTVIDGAVYRGGWPSSSNIANGGHLEVYAESNFDRRYQDGTGPVLVDTATGNNMRIVSSNGVLSLELVI